ncbi:uncharacterized protein YALI1_A13591g [Yarrowia lipolytica]|uniref:Uncharacterized protein n=1 Tax=Yarrowia lipolytica TaxID=4952 RepID=A0A1D8N4R6_YARLL|nr:hypothetical protein YALI1_A13591g [Yarrowia lipolytica]
MIVTPRLSDRPLKGHYCRHMLQSDRISRRRVGEETLSVAYLMFITATIDSLHQIASPKTVEPKYCGHRAHLLSEHCYMIVDSVST